LLQTTLHFDHLYSSPTIFILTEQLFSPKKVEN